jgi:hypothetical protein
MFADNWVGSRCGVFNSPRSSSCAKQNKTGLRKQLSELVESARKNGETLGAVQALITKAWRGISA